MLRNAKNIDAEPLMLQLLSVGIPAELVEDVVACTRGALSWAPENSARCFTVYWTATPQVVDSEGLRWVAEAADLQGKLLLQRCVWHAFYGRAADRGVFAAQAIPDEAIALVDFQPNRDRPLRVLEVNPNHFTRQEVTHEQTDLSA